MQKRVQVKQRLLRLSDVMQLDSIQFSAPNSNWKQELRRLESEPREDEPLFF